jgi:FtsZ-interacting cell division protein ZipA
MQSKQQTLRNIALVVFGIVILVLLVNTKRVAGREDAYLQEMRVFKEQSELATQYADSLKKQVRVHETETAAARARATTAELQARKSKNTTNVLLQELDSLKETVTDSIEMARLIIPKQDTIITQQQVTITKQDTQIVFLGVALTETSTALTLSNQRGDSLQTVVNNIPDPPKPPMLPTISRKQAFVGGVVVGVILKVFVF